MVGRLLLGEWPPVNHDALFFGALLHGEGRAGDLKRVQAEHLDETWAKVYNFCLDHVRQTGRLPHAETVEMSCGVMVGPAPEGIDFYARRIRENAMRLAMEDGFVSQVVQPLGQNETQKALHGAKAVVSDVTRRFAEEGSGASLDYHENVSIRMLDYALRESAGGLVGLPTPWRSLTTMTGGFLPGELWVLAARPNLGKSWAMILVAIMLYQAGYRVLFCSMETPAQGRLPKNQRHRVVRGTCVRCFMRGVSGQEPCPAAKVNRQRLSIRFDALGAQLSAWRMLQATLTPREKERYQHYLRVCADPQAHGYDWGSIRIVAPPDVRSLVELEVEILSYQPDIVLWDSAYLAAQTQGRQSRKDAYDDLIDGFADLLKRESLAGMMSWHFKREVTEKATSAGLGDTSYTDELGRLVDVVVGLFRPPEMQEAHEAILRTLKVRDGVRMPELRTKWMLKSKIDFTEIEATDTEADKEVA